MSCSHPLIGLPSGSFTKYGKPAYKIVSSDSMFKRDFEHLQENFPGAILIPCGKCMECRLAYSRQWADRMMLELEDQKKAIFLTLTYDENHVPPATYQSVVYPGFLPVRKNDILQGSEYLIPEYCTLRKRDIQLFLKRMRKAFAPLKLRYYAAGEYGDETHRPHYHMILYGLDIDDFETCNRGVYCRECSCSEEKFKLCRSSMIKVPARKNELGDQYYTSPLLEKIWKNGHVYFSEVSWKTCAYVARYVTKKWHGDYAVDYMVRNCEPEFCLQSRRPGIGRAYFDRHPELLDFANIHLETPDGGIKMNVPKYFLRIAELTDKEKVDKLKEVRKQASEDAMKLHHENTTLKPLDYLEMKEQKKLDSVKVLRRNKL